MNNNEPLLTKCQIIEFVEKEFNLTGKIVLLKSDHPYRIMFNLYIQNIPRIKFWWLKRKIKAALSKRTGLFYNFVIINDTQGVFNSSYCQIENKCTQEEFLKGYSSVESDMENPYIKNSPAFKLFNEGRKTALSSKPGENPNG